MITIGRAKDNEIVLNDRRVSRKHAFIFNDGTGFKVVDGYVENGQLFRSVNHVFVNDEMRLEHVLNDADVLIIGESRLEFRESEEISTTKSRGPITLSSTIGRELQRLQEVNFDDSPLGHTQVAISVNEIIGRKSNLTIESAVATAE